MVVHVRSFLSGRGQSCAFTAIKLKDFILEFQVWFNTYGKVYFTEASLCMDCIPSFSGICISCFFKDRETRLGESHWSIRVTNFQKASSVSPVASLPADFPSLPLSTSWTVLGRHQTTVQHWGYCFLPGLDFQNVFKLLRFLKVC